MIFVICVPAFVKTKPIESPPKYSYDLIPDIFFVYFLTNIPDVWFTMKKLLLILAGASSLSVAPMYAQAADKILSPVAGWKVEKLKAIGEKSACLVYSQYEDGVALSLESLQSQLSAIRFAVASGTFETGQSYNVAVDITPHYRKFKSAQAVSENELVIDAAKDVELLKAIQHGFIITIATDDWSYGLSLSGASDGVRRLLTCRDTNWSAVRRVYDPVKNKALASEHADGLPMQINAYPLDREGETDNVVTEEMDDVIHHEDGLFVADNQTLSRGSSNKNHDYIVETETIEVMEQGGAVLDLSDADQTQAVVVEPINTITRVHTPKVKIRPRHQDTGDGNKAVVDVAVPVRGDDDLVKPPEFDEALLDQGRQMAVAEADSSEMPAPERNPKASLSSPNENVRRLARKTDSEHEILMDRNDVPKRNQNAVLSQSPDGVYTKPVVIPRIPESDFPNRIDLTNHDVKARQDGSFEKHSNRDGISNQELEQEMKVYKSSNIDDTDESGSAVKLSAHVKDVDLTPLDTALPKAHLSDDVVSKSAERATARWIAGQGDDLRETLAKWSIEEDVELIWDSEKQYKLLSAVKMNASYEKVIAHVLNKYMTTPDLKSRPVGQLYVDPDNGSKVLIVQSDQD